MGFQLAAPDLGDASTFHDTATEVLDRTARAVGIANVTAVPRPGPVGFHYPTSISPPTLHRADWPAIDISATGDDVIAFGMVDANISVRARRAVVDPQHSRDTWWHDQVTAEELCLVLNAGEALRLTGASRVTDAAEELIRTERYEAVVVKLGALGALVARPGTETVHLDPYPTTEVFPIGSGDVFTAVFAWEWAQGADPVRAAASASHGTSLWCGARNLPLPASILDAEPALARRGD